MILRQSGSRHFGTVECASGGTGDAAADEVGAAISSDARSDIVSNGMRCASPPGVLQVLLLLSAYLIAAVMTTGDRTLDKGRSTTVGGRASSGELAASTPRRLPLVFEENHGQADRRVRFLARGQGYRVSITPEETVMRLGGPAPRPSSGRQDRAEAGLGPDGVLRLRVVGSSARAVTGLEALPGKANYIVGSDPSGWHTGLPTFGKVQVGEVYPGIDQVFYGEKGASGLEYDFVVAPGADPSVIRVAFEGGARPRLDDQGALIVETAAGTVVQRPPHSYQRVEGARRTVRSRYILDGAGHVGFLVGRYDPRRTLIIDPVVSYSTYLGGSVGQGSDVLFGGNEDWGQSIAVDGSGQAYVAGYTTSSDFPMAGDPYQSTRPGGGPSRPAYDIFVTKLNASGTALVYSTYLGGSGYDRSEGIALDPDGNTYVVGTTDSANFPTRAPVQQHLGGDGDAFVTKLNPSGSGLVYSTYLGGSGLDWATGVSVGPNGRKAFVTGNTESTNFPTKNAFRTSLAGKGDAFVAKLKQGGSALAYSTYLGGSRLDEARSIAVDAAGDAYVGGYTASSDLPATRALQPAKAGFLDGWAGRLRIAPLGTVRLVYLTYLGGDGDDFVAGVAVDGSGNAHLAGDTTSSDLPVEGALQPVIGGGVDAFVTKLGPAGDLVYSTYLGGSSNDEANGVTVDRRGSAYVTGGTSSSDFPITDAAQPANNGAQDCFVTKLKPSGAALKYSTYLGGAGPDVPYAIAVDPLGGAYVTGVTFSPNFPTTAGSFQPVAPSTVGGFDSFVTKLS